MSVGDSRPAPRLTLAGAADIFCRSPTFSGFIDGGGSFDEQQLPSAHPQACSIFGPGRAASSCSPTTSRWAPAPSIRRRPCARSGPKPWRAAYVQPSRRPTDGRYGENPNRLQHYYQFQVILKPAPADSQALYLDSLDALGIDPRPSRHPLRRGRLGKPDPGRLGSRLGGLARRHGGDPVHLFPAGRRHRMRSGLDRAHLRARAARHVCAGRRERLRPRLQRRRRHLRRGVQARRARVLGLSISSSPIPNACCGISATRKRNATRSSKRSCRCRPTTSASRRATASICWTRAA